MFYRRTGSFGPCLTPGLDYDAINKRTREEAKKRKNAAKKAAATKAKNKKAKASAKGKPAKTKRAARKTRS